MSRTLDVLPRLKLKPGDSSGRPLGFLLHQRLPRPGGLPLRSYTVSTGCDRPPGGQNVACRVDIAVMDRAAPASPLTDVQRQHLTQDPALRAHLGRREPPVDGDEVSPIP